MKEKVVAIVLLTIMMLNAVDVFTDLQLNVPTWHVISEGIIVFISGVVGLYLIHDIRQSTRRLEKLSQELLLSNRKVEQLDDDMKKRVNNTVNRLGNNWSNGS